VNIILKLEDTEAKAKLANLAKKGAEVDKQADEVVRKWGRTRAVVMRQIQQVNIAIGGIVSTFSAVLSLIGQTLDPIQTALVQLIQTSLQSILAVHRMIEAGSVGIAAGFTIALSISAMGLSALAYQAAVEGTEEARATYAKAESAILGLQTSVMALGSMGY
jgi:hypothetical protein